MVAALEVLIGICASFVIVTNCRDIALDIEYT